MADFEGNKVAQAGILGEIAKIETDVFKKLDHFSEAAKLTTDLNQAAEFLKLAAEAGKNAESSISGPDERSKLFKSELDLLRTLMNKLSKKKAEKEEINSPDPRVFRNAIDTIIGTTCELGVLTKDAKSLLEIGKAITLSMQLTTDTDKLATLSRKMQMYIPRIIKNSNSPSSDLSDLIETVAASSVRTTNENAKEKLSNLMTQIFEEVGKLGIRQGFKEEFFHYFANGIVRELSQAKNKDSIKTLSNFLYQIFELIKGTTR